MTQNNDFFNRIDVSDNIDYDHNTLLDENQYYKIENFSKKDFSIDIIKNFTSTSLTDIQKCDFEKINFLIAIQDNQQLFYFQKIYTKQIINKKWFNLNPTNKKYFIEEDGIFVINDLIDAVYEKSMDTLYFKKIDHIKTIFKGIETLYREATQTEVDTFLSDTGVEWNGRGEIPTKYRKSIALLIDKIYDHKANNTFINLVQYAQNNCINTSCDDIIFQNNKFIISNAKGLKKILYAFDERFHETTVTKENRLANSVQRV